MGIWWGCNQRCGCSQVSSVQDLSIYCLDLFGRVWRSKRTVASLLLHWFLVLHWILFAQGQQKVERGIDSFFCWLGSCHCNNLFANMCYRYFLVWVASSITRHGFDNYGGPFLQSAKKGARCLAQQQTKAPARLEDRLPPPASPPGPDCTNAIDPLEDWKARWTAGSLFQTWAATIVEGCGCMAMAIYSRLGGPVSKRPDAVYGPCSNGDFTYKNGGGNSIYLTEVVGIIYPVAARSYGSIHIPDKNWGTKELNNWVSQPRDRIWGYRLFSSFQHVSGSTLSNFWLRWP